MAIVTRPWLPAPGLLAVDPTRETDRDVRYAELGTEVEVGRLVGCQKRIPAPVVRFPFYDPEKTRPRS
jgi:hypothetical protein